MNNTFTYKVYYEDTDSGGVVYYANYLKFLERARSDMFHANGVSQTKLAKSNIFFVVRKCEIEYFSPAKLEDILHITCQIEKITKVAVLFVQEIKCENKLLAIAKVKVVSVTKSHHDFKPLSIPQDVLLTLAKNT
jgi:tol-pal system-associated acyl-CoA thioesterase